MDRAFNHTYTLEFGKSLGEALNAVYLYNPKTKSETDAKGFIFLDYFLTGFYNSRYFYIKYYGESLYNSMNGLGSQVAGPFEDLIDEYTKAEFSNR